MIKNINYYGTNTINSKSSGIYIYIYIYNKKITLFYANILYYFKWERVQAAKQSPYFQITKLSPLILTLSLHNTHKCSIYLLFFFQAWMGFFVFWSNKFKMVR